MEAYWVQTTTRPSFLKLEKDLDTDVCIIGAGITGIMTAYMLLNSGLKICVNCKWKMVQLIIKIFRWHNNSNNLLTDKNKNFL